MTRQAQEFYETPAWCVHLLLDAGVIPHPSDRKDNPPSHWMEPCVGGGAIIRAVNSWSGIRVAHRSSSRVEISLSGMTQSPVLTSLEMQLPRWSGIELNRVLELPGVNFKLGDFLSVLPYPPYDDVLVIITNPPYGKPVTNPVSGKTRMEDHVMDFVVHAFKWPSAWIVMLLRLNWAGSQDRSSYLKEHAPDVYVLSKRPSFVGGGTDATEYAWFVWPPGQHNRKQGVFRVLGVP